MAENEIIPEIVYGNALALVFDAIASANKGLFANPSKEEERKLHKALLRLEVERADLVGMLDAMADGETLDVDAPTQTEVDEIANLTGQVAGLTKANLTAAGAISVTSGVLALAMKVTGG